MNKGFRKLLTLIFTSAAAFALSACGGGGGGGSETIAVTGLSISSQTITLEEEKTTQLTATVYPTDATNKAVTWSSNNASIASVNDSGLVTAVKAGSAIVTAKTVDGGFTKACKVTISEKLPPAIGTVSLVFGECFGQLIKDNLQPQFEEFKRLVRINDLYDINIQLADSSDYKSLESDTIANFSIGVVPNICVAYPDHVADYIALEPHDGDYVVRIDELAKDPEIGFGTEEWLGDNPDDLEYEDRLGDFIESYIEEGKQFIKEGLYCFPYMKSTEAMYYNVQAVNTALSYLHPEISSPAAVKDYMDSLDWDEFMDLCQAVLEHKSEISSVLVAPAFYDSDSNLFISQMFQQDIPFSSVQDGAGHIDFETGEARTAAEALLTDYKSAYDAGLFTTKGAHSTYGSNSFKNIESVFSIGSTGGAGYNLTTEFDIGICKVPTRGDAGKGCYVSQGPSLCIMQNPDKTPEQNAMETKYAFKLLKFLTQPENNAALCTKGTEGYLPVRESAYYSDAYIDFIGGGGYIAQTAQVVTDKIDGNFLSTACFKGSSELRTQVTGMVSSVLLGMETVTNAVTKAINETIAKM